MLAVLNINFMNRNLVLMPPGWGRYLYYHTHFTGEGPEIDTQ